MHSKPNFSLAYIKANTLLATTKATNTFPYHPKELIKEQGNNIVACRSFSKAKGYGLDPRNLGSESAVITKLYGKIIIFYNDTKPISHVKFSILHEYGHLLLNHSLNCSDDDLYRIYEIEANYFAAQMLMPDQIIRELEKRGKNISCEFLMRTFNVCEQAASKRIETLKKTYPEYRRSNEKEFDDIIRMKYLDLINSLCTNNAFNYDNKLKINNHQNQCNY